jgi:tetratricopeptide (TPR) repeat protein
MSKISLRDYNHEIEGLINSGRTDEAIAHSKYILRLFPKCVDTYRLLGKAYLEAQRYSEATDILTRILSVVPDDFVSQIGMSIIREDEGNLDAAIYHMERAFEVKPSNSAIQEELRRLYGRRDGITPPRVRLTRGALVRMYSRGELYPQAIAEIRAALVEDPKRVDLEVILARIYMVLGRKAEAIEVCSRLVNKLPNCLEANRILAEILPGTSRAEDAEVYKQRVIALDPYSASITSSTPTSAEVADNAILIDFLEYSPAQAGSQQPEWAQSVGINLQETEETIPDWLVEKPAVQAAGLPEPPPTPAPQPEITEYPQAADQAPEAPVEASEHDALIPDWMKSAGWTEAAPAPVEEKETPAPPEETTEEIAQAEMPDWLKAIAPAQVEETPALESDQEDLARLDQLLNSQAQEPASPEEISPVEPAAPAPVEAVAQPEAIQPAAELPTWLEEPPSDQASAAAQAVSQEEVPDWLAGLSVPADTTPAPAEATPAEELPDWLKSFASETPAETSLEPVADTSPDWIKDIQSTTETVQSEEEPASEIPLSFEEPMPEWLKGLGEEVQEPADISAISPVEAQAEVPAVPVEAALVPEPEPEAAMPEEQAEIPAIPLEAALLPETEVEAFAPEAQAEVPVEMPVASTEADLREPQIELGEAVVEEPAAKTQPVAVKKIELPMEEAAPVIGQESALEPATAEIPADESIDAALAWLESLAAQQGVDQDTLLVPPDQRTERPPAWIQKEIDDAQAALAETPAAAETPLESEILPVSQPEPETFAPIAEQIPAEEIQQPAPEEGISQPVEAVAIETGEVPAEGISVPESVAAVETPAPATTSPEDMDLDSAFAWLESLAARQGAEPETLSTPAGEQPEETQAWVSEAAAEEESQPVAEMPEPSAEIPAVFETTTPELPVIEPEAPTEPVAEVEIPEGISPAPEIPSAEFLAETPAGEEALPDWLKGLETPPAEIAPTPAPVSGESVSIWLKNIKVPEEQEPGIVSEQPVEQTPEEPLPEWLQGIEAVTPMPAETIAPVTEPSDELPDWLKETEPPVPEITGEAVEEGLPEWLQGLETTAEPVEVPVFPVEPVAEEIIPSAEVFQEQPAEQLPPVEEFAAEAGQVAEIPQEQPIEFVPLAEAPIEIAPLEEPIELIPVEEPAPVAEEEPAAIMANEQPEIFTEPLEEIPQAVTAAKTEEEVFAVAGMDISQVLNEARGDLDAGELDQSLPKYSKLIESQAYLDEIIGDLQNALYRHPVNVALHETLGDAYARSSRLQDALDTYTKAEELLVK